MMAVVGEEDRFVKRMKVAGVGKRTGYQRTHASSW